MLNASLNIMTQCQHVTAWGVGQKSTCMVPLFLQGWLTWQEERVTCPWFAIICLPPLCAAPDWDYLECLQFKLISWAELPFRFLSVIDNLCASFQVLLSEGNFGESNLVKNFYLESKSWSSNSPKLHYIKGVRHSSMVVSKVEKPFWNRKTEGFWDS